MQNQLKTDLLLLSVAAISACAGRADPEPAEVFRLTEVGGQPLPVSYPEEQGCTEEVLGATLALEADGEWEMRMAKREVCGERVVADEEREDGRYAVDGQTVRFVDQDGESEESEEEDAGEVDADDLAVGTRSADGLAVQLADGQTVLAFRR